MRGVKDTHVLCFNTYACKKSSWIFLIISQLLGFMYYDKITTFLDIINNFYNILKYCQKFDNICLCL